MASLKISSFNPFNQLRVKQFLPGIKVNKINNILGMTNFGTQYFKSNLLVGTSHGPYFSNSTAQSTSIPPSITLTHLDVLGTVSINDIQIEVANISQIYPLVDCEDGAWLCTDDGLYFIKPDFGKYYNLTTANFIHFEGLANSINSLTLCNPISTNLVLNDDVSGNNIQWYKDNQQIAGAIAKQPTVSSSGDYYAVLYDPCSDIHVESNHLVVNANVPLFSFNYPDKLQYCAGKPVSLTVAGNSSYQYRWYSDGTLNGNASQTLNISQSGKYKVEVSSCQDNWLASKEVEVDLISIPIPVVKPDKPSYCISDHATMSLTIPPDPSYTINWYLDNQLLSANKNQTSFNTNTPGSYKVVVTANSPNTDGTFCSQTSKAQDIAFNPLPTVSIQQIVTSTLCDGQTVDLKLIYYNGTVQWNNGQRTDDITVSQSGTYTATVTNLTGCSQSATSNVQFLANPVLYPIMEFACPLTKSQPLQPRRV